MYTFCPLKQHQLTRKLCTLQKQECMPRKQLLTKTTASTQSKTVIETIKSILDIISRFASGKSIGARKSNHYKNHFTDQINQARQEPSPPIQNIPPKKSRRRMPTSYY